MKTYIFMCKQNYSRMFFRVKDSFDAFIFGTLNLENSSDLSALGKRVEIAQSGRKKAL